jgi:two-component system, cell cycle sensor histidine kinase and response regulator CckA
MEHRPHAPHQAGPPGPEGPDLFRAIVESAPIGVVVVDRKGFITFANPEIERQFGYTNSELVGQPIELLVPRRARPTHAADRDAFQAHASPRAMGAGRDLTGLRKDGTEFPVEVGLTPFDGGSGPLIMASVVDISTRMAAERALRDREERFRQLAGNIHEVFFLLDAQLRETVYINPAYEVVWGRSCESLYEDPSSFLDGIATEDRDRALDHLSKVQRGSDAGDLELTVVRPDGQPRSVLVRAVPITNEQGEVYRIAGLCLDITERRRALDEVGASERRLRTLFETVNLIVLALDTDGRIEYANPYFLGLTGASQEETFGADWFSTFVPAGSRESTRDAFRELLEKARPEHFRSAIVSTSGEERTIAWHSTTVTDPQGRATGTLSIGEDVTDVLKLEQQYRQAQKMEAVGRLAGGIAHDFNNVLTVISGYSQLLIETFDAADTRRDDVGAIRDAAASAATLTRQLLAFSRQQVLEPRVLDLNEVVLGAERMLQRLIGEDVDLTTMLEPDLAHVLADAGQLEQVLMNLAVNARDAMPQGGHLVLETSNVDLADGHAWEPHPMRSGSFAMLAVSDSGVGMDEATRGRIFEPFFTTKEPGEGTGLGLATVYGIVKQSDGFIWVYSEPGQGTTFKIYLPRAEGGAVPVAEPDAGPLPKGTETVLLVEDAAGVRAITRELLTRAGYTVLEAPDGATGIAIASRHPGPIHLLLTDVVMPGMNGREVAERLVQARPEIRVAFMSGYTDDAVTRAGVLHGGVHYLSKPFTPHSLVRKVREALDSDR